MLEVKYNRFLVEYVRELVGRCERVCDLGQQIRHGGLASYGVVNARPPSCCPVSFSKNGSAFTEKADPFYALYVLILQHRVEDVGQSLGVEIHYSVLSRMGQENIPSTSLCSAGCVSSRFALGHPVFTRKESILTTS